MASAITVYQAGSHPNDVTMRCTAAMATANVVVILDTSNEGYVKVPTAVTDVPFGVVLTTAATAGDPVIVRPISSGAACLVKAHGAFSLGDALSIAATTGKVDTAASTHYPVGLAMQAATAQDDEVTCILGGSLIPRA